MCGVCLNGGRLLSECVVCMHVLRVVSVCVHVCVRVSV